MLPYFKKSENNLNIHILKPKYHGVHGEQAVSFIPTVDEPVKMILDAYQELGLPLTDINGESQYGAINAQITAKYGQRVSTYNAFIQRIRYKRKNLTVKVEAEANEILINTDNVAYGVKYVTHGKEYTAFAKKEVIVSAGSINSPKLLMLSGVGPKEHLSKLNIPVKKDLAVGENLHDHATFNGYLIVLPNETSTLVDKGEVLDEVCAYSEMEIKHGPLAFGGLDYAISFWKSDPNLSKPDVQIHVGGTIVKEFINEPINFDSVRIFPSAFYNGIYPRLTTLAPKSRGKLLLNESDPHGPPILYSGYYKDPTDFIPIIKIARLYLTLEKTRAFRSVGAYFDRTPLSACKDYPWGSDDYTVCLATAYTSSALHPVGTCKMGPYWDEKAVVDPRLKVYGISGLRVIDSSIMPCVTNGNTNAPSIMIGERGVAFVLEDWLSKY